MLPPPSCRTRSSVLVSTWLLAHELSTDCRREADIGEIRVMLVVGRLRRFLRTRLLCNVSALSCRWRGVRRHGEPDGDEERNVLYDDEMFLSEIRCGVPTTLSDSRTRLCEDYHVKYRVLLPTTSFSCLRPSAVLVASHLLPHGKRVSIVRGSVVPASGANVQCGAPFSMV